MTATVSNLALRKAQTRDLRTDLDLTRDELSYLLDLTAQVKAAPSRYYNALSNRYLTLLFEKPSLRTRLTFELAIKQLGGDAVAVIGPIGNREPVKDIARNLDRWSNALVARVYSQDTIEQLAHWSKAPVINALSDTHHPCQALADVFTLGEKLGTLEGRKVAFIGDGNNVAHSLMLCCARLGANFAIACPAGYEPKESIVEQARAFGASTGAIVEVTRDPYAAVVAADAVYTDVWASMGQEAEAEERSVIFEPYQVNEKLMAAGPPHMMFMHCLPAKAGQEVTEAVAEGGNSVIFDQAENRLHAQKALLLMMLD
ncbi:MAG TPA: ornithine carbamoyltransferase [Bryobacteraceae bacterium]|nr:ornithine carbamoyltransferase [Bryobacteraceae bacterium]